MTGQEEVCPDFWAEDGTEVKGCGKDADDGGGVGAEGDVGSEDFGVGVELALPEWVAHDDGGTAAFDEFIVRTAGGPR